MLLSHVETFEGTIAGLGATQLLTSWAVTIADIHTYPKSLEDPHATLGLILAMLAGISQAVPLWSGVFKEKPVSLKFRQTLNLVQSPVFLGSCLGRSEHYNASATPKWIAMALIVIALFTCLWNAGLLVNMYYKAAERESRKDVTAEAFAVFFAAVVTIFLAIVVLIMKFGLKNCSLNTAEDNQWTFGQWLTIIMAVAPFLSAFEEFLGNLCQTLFV